MSEMTKVDQIYRRLEQESGKLDESIEIVKISLNLVRVTQEYCGF